MRPDLPWMPEEERTDGRGEARCQGGVREDAVAAARSRGRAGSGGSRHPPARGIKKNRDVSLRGGPKPYDPIPKDSPETRATGGGRGGVRTLHGGVDLGGHGRGLLELGAHARELARHLRTAEGWDGTDERGVGEALAGALGGGDECDITPDGDVAGLGRQPDARDAHLSDGGLDGDGRGGHLDGVVRSRATHSGVRRGCAERHFRRGGGWRVLRFEVPRRSRHFWPRARVFGH